MVTRKHRTGMDHLDIIFCSIPYRDLDHIYSAPAILKSIVVNNGYTAMTKDFGLDLLELCNNDTDLLDRIQQYFITAENNLSESENTILNNFYSRVVDFFKTHPSKFIGISVFSIFTHKSTVDILTLLKQHRISSKIIVGGRGVKVPINIAAQRIANPSKLEKMLELGEFLKKRKLVDYAVVGDGEDAILDILKGDELKYNYNTETFNYPLPDYSDYDFSKYLWNDGPVMFPITGSKGCVRDCDFCDIKYQFGKYKYRNGKDIANEMIYIAENLGYRKFQFTDSLVNGGLKILEEFCTIIADYNDKNPDNTISWNGQYICRPASEMPERLYPLMAKSGAHGLTIGAESGSDHVLDQMNKKTDVESLFYELEQFEKYKITCVLLTFVGHWAETHDDFVNHCGTIVKILPYIRSGTISALSLGATAVMLEGTPSMKYVADQQIVLSEFNQDFVWYAKFNSSNTYKERILRRLVLHMLAKRLAIPIRDEWNFLNIANVIIEKHHREINEFYQECTRNFR